MHSHQLITSDTEMLDAALGYARLGLCVFPVWHVIQYGEQKFACSCGKGTRCAHPGKHPHRMAVNGCKSATADEAMVRHIWSCAPNANIGIALAADMAVLDVDPQHEGDKTLADLERRHAQLPDTWRVRTGGGGSHLYFKVDAGIRNSAGKIGIGLDIKTAGGFVLPPPSLHISSRRYAWEQHPDQTPLAPMPEWLVALCRSPSNKKAMTPAAGWRQLVKDGVGDGCRNASIARLAGHLLRRHIDPVVALELLTVWDAVRCRPPLGEAEVRDIVISITECEMRRRGEMS